MPLPSMNIVIIFVNIGAYHAARIRAFNAVCKQKGWALTAVQMTSDSLDHPWGAADNLVDCPIITLQHEQTNCTGKKEVFRLLSRSLDSLKPDAVVIPGWGYLIAQAAIRWSVRSNVPAILMSESKQDDEPRTWWKEKLKSLLYVRKFKSALVGGCLHKDYLVQLGCPKEAIFFGYDIVDNDYFSNQAQKARKNPTFARKQDSQIPHRPYFIAVARFIPRKNILRLVDAFAQYRRYVEPDRAWDLVVCGGGGTEENAIRDRIAEHQLESSICLPGFKTYVEMPVWFGLASAFIHPALSEQWGLVVNEALSSGLPVLVSNRCGCFPELVQEGINGFGFDPEDTEQISQLMVKVSKSNADLDEMSKAALKHIQRFSPATFGEGLAQAVEYALP